MKISKSLCGAIIGAALLIACLGPGTAFGKGSICSVSQNPCQKANQLPMIRAESAHVVFSRLVAEGSPVSCHSAMTITEKEGTWAMSQLEWWGCAKTVTTTLMPSNYVEAYAFAPGHLETTSNTEVFFEGLTLGVKCTVKFGPQSEKIVMAPGKVSEKTATISTKVQVTTSGFACANKDTVYMGANGASLAGLETEPYRVVSAENISGKPHTGSIYYSPWG